MNPAAATGVPDAATLEALYGKSLLLTTDWPRESLEALLAVAARLEAADRAGRSLHLLPDELAYALFFDHSTRTKSAWAGAAARLLSALISTAVPANAPLASSTAGPTASTALLRLPTWEAIWTVPDSSL